jgi:predicted alpha-1,2-mannosidase
VIRRALPAAVALALLLLPASRAAAEDLTPLVHPLSGTLGAGFPMVGASAPFGMLQLGPDTGLADGSEDPVNYDGYGFQDPTIRDFSLTHFDGAGIPIAGDLPFMPAVGSGDAASPYDHASEVATPGYYAVTLARYGVRVELTASERAGMVRLTYPATSQASLTFMPTRSIGHTHPGAISVTSDHTLSGWARSDVGYTVYFAASFDRPFRSNGSGTLTFDATTDRVATMRIALSYVDAAGAQRNLAASESSFDAMRRAAHDAWDARLHDVRETGGDRPTFYTNLYRALLMPSLFDDADGRYLGFDGQVHQVAPGTHHYTNLSLWDTYRTQTPLLELLEPRVAHDVAVSLLDDYDQNHQVIPRWTQANVDRGIMGGDSATPTLADAVSQGVLSGSEARRAYAAMLHQATTLPPVWPREHLDAYLSLGYVPNDVSGIGTALTQEYAIDDAALLSVARTYGNAGDVAALAGRAGSWRNLLDPSTKFVRPRNKDGSWANPESPAPWSPDFQNGYQEGTGWQYLWAEPQDVAGLASAIGGRSAALSRLDSFFSAALNHPAAPVVPLAQQYGSFYGIYYIGDQYTPANETDLWTGWYYDWLGEPWKAQRVVRSEMATYNARPDGLPGNDDTGTMSAWYVLAALGIYRVTPGVPAFELSSPAVDQATIELGRRTFTIAGAGNSPASPYVQAARLDGVPLDRTYLTTCELRRGGRLDVALGPVPNRRWAAGGNSAPPSLSAAATATGCGAGGCSRPGGCQRSPSAARP